MTNYVEDLVQEIYTKCDTKGLDQLNKGTQMAVFQTAALEKNLLAIKALQHEGYSAIAKNLKASVAAMGALNYGIRSANKENLKSIDLTKQAFLGKKHETQLLALNARERLKYHQLEARMQRQREKWQEADIRRGQKQSWLYRNLGKIFVTMFGLQAIKGMIDTGSRMQLTQQSIKGLTGSTQDWGFLKEQSFRTGTDIEVAARGYRNFYSSAKTAGFNKTSIQGMFSDVLLATRAIGASTQQTEGALLALEQMISKGTVSMEELRRQLGNAIPGAFEIGAKAMNMTTKELTDFVKKGELASSEFVPRFIKTLVETYAKGFKDIEQTVSVAQIRLSNSWKQIQADIVSGEAGKSFVKGLDELRKLLESKTFKDFVNILGQAFSLVVQILSFLIKHLGLVITLLGFAGICGWLHRSRSMIKLMAMDITMASKVMLRFTGISKILAMNIGTGAKMMRIFGLIGRNAFKGMTLGAKAFKGAIFSALFPLLLLEDVFMFVGEKLGWNTRSALGASLAALEANGGFNLTSALQNYINTRQIDNITSGYGTFTNKPSLKSSKGFTNVPILPSSPSGLKPNSGQSIGDFIKQNQKTNNVSVNINVNSNGGDAQQIGNAIYDIISNGLVALDATNNPESAFSVG